MIQTLVFSVPRHNMSEDIIYGLWRCNLRNVYKPVIK